MNEEENEIEVQRYESDRAEGIEVLKRLTNEEEVAGDEEEMTFRSIIGGDILKSRFLMRQIYFVIFVVILTSVYTANRYMSQQDAILIDRLRKELPNEYNKVLTQSSELMNMSRQSSVELRLIANGDSALLDQSTPPMLVKGKEE